MPIKGRLPKSPEERFWAKVQKSEDPNGCWEWIGAQRPDGTGIFTLMVPKKTTTAAYNPSYEWANGPIPKGMSVVHSCAHKSCVNPAHLQLASDDSCNKCLALLDEKRQCKECRRQTKHDWNLKNTLKESNITPSLEGNQKCDKCLKDKAKRMFYVNRSTKNGLMSWCKQCFATYNRDLLRKSEETFGVSWGSRLLRTHKSVALRYGYSPLLNITGKQVSEWRQEISSCEICGRTDCKLQLDHDHITGQVRGWICINCNTKLVPLVERGLHIVCLDYLARPPRF